MMNHTERDSIYYNDADDRELFEDEDDELDFDTENVEADGAYRCSVRVPFLVVDGVPYYD